MGRYLPSQIASEGLYGPLEASRRLGLKANNDEALTLWREAMTAPKHLHADADNVSIKLKQGASRAYTLVRLKAGPKTGGWAG